MNTKSRNSNKYGDSRPDDYLRLLASRVIEGSQLLDEMIISKALSEAIEEWLLDLRIEGRSKATIRFYRQNLEPFRRFIEANEPVNLKSINADNIRSYLLHYQNISHSSAFALHAKYRSLRAFWNWAIRESYAISNPIQTLKAPRLPKKIIATFRAEDIKSMLAQCDNRTFLNLRNRAIILMLYDTGMRVGELVGMRLKDVDVEQSLVHVTGKGNKMRTMHISSTTLKALWRYLKTPPRPAIEKIWLSEERRPLTNDGVRQAIRKIASQAGITGVRASPHTFRHTFAINFLREGGNVFDLQILGGWESLDMVKRYAQALNIDDALKAHRKFSPVDRL